MTDTKRRRKSKSTPLGDKLRVFAAGYRATGQDERAEGLLQAADAADGEPGHVVPNLAADPIDRIRDHGHALVDAIVEWLVRPAPVTDESWPKPVLLIEPPAPKAPRQHTTLIDPPKARAPKADPVEGLSKYAAGLLRVLVSRHGHGATTKQLAILSGRSAGSSDFSKATTALTRDGFATREGGRLYATQHGQLAVGPVEAMPTGPALAEHWIAKLPGYEARLLSAFLARYPEPVSIIELADATGYSETSSSFTRAISALKKLGLIAGMRASSDLVA